jgi:hypothetical protein
VDAGHFEHVIEGARALHERLGEFSVVAVGGTAVALHCEHRFSLDVDVVTPLLSRRFDEVKAALETWQGWRTNRLNPPVLILGQRAGVELGVRQLRRTVRLETTDVGGLRVPTAAEMLRIKAFLLTERRATRDFVDVAALVRHLGETAAIKAASLFNLIYGARAPQTWVTAFAEACESEPIDRDLIPLSSYKGLHAPFTDWDFVSTQCRQLGRALLKRELEGALPLELPPNLRPDAPK